MRVGNPKDIGETFRFEASKEKIIIGRRSTCDINIGGDNTLSNMHCKVSFVDDQWFLEDLGTTNGTWSELE